MSIWRGSFKAAFELSKSLLRNYLPYLLSFFILGFILNLMVESPFAPGATPTSTPVFAQIMLGLWSMVEGFLMFFIVARGAAPEVVWTKDTWWALAAESLRVLMHILLWSLLLIIPGLVQYVLLIFVTYIVVFSKKYQAGEVDALKFSRQMVKPHFFSIALAMTGFSLVASSLELAPQMELALNPFPIRLIFEICSFLISFYGYCLIYIVFRKCLKQAESL